MSTLTIKTANGYTQELPDCELLAIDGVPADGFKRIDISELDNRIILLEQYLVGVLAFLDKKFPNSPAIEISPIPQEESSNSIEGV